MSYEEEDTCMSYEEEDQSFSRRRFVMPEQPTQSRFVPVCVCVCVCVIHIYIHIYIYIYTSMGHLQVVLVP
jgi:hypothetical protein